MRAIRVQLEAMIHVEERLRDERTQNVQSATRNFLSLSVVFILATALMAVRALYQRKHFERKLSLWKNTIEFADWI